MCLTALFSVLVYVYVCVCVCVSDKFGVFPASRVTQSITCGLQGQWAEEMKGYQRERGREGKDWQNGQTERKTETFKLEAM